MTSSGELPLDQIGRRPGVFVALGRVVLFAPNRAFQAILSHQTSNALRADTLTVNLA